MSVWYHAPIRNGNLGPRCFHGKLYTHLMADSDEELLKFAVEQLNMKRQWAQNLGTFRAHFDVTGARLRWLQQHPDAEEIDRKTYVKKMQERIAAGRGQRAAPDA